MGADGPTDPRPDTTAREIAGRYNRDEHSISYRFEIARMYLQHDDNRALKLAERKGFTARRVFGLWSRLVARTDARFVLDVGANHGEMILPLLLPAQARVFAFEPNPGLADGLERSIATHVQSAAFEVVRSAVSDAVGTSRFNVDRKWSGTSSLDFQRADSPFKGSGKQAFDVIDVPTTTLDTFAASRLSGPDDAVLALKVDIEGHEPQLFAGAAATLAARPFFALFEVSTAQMRLTGTSPEQYLTSLQDLGRLHRITRDGVLQPFDDPADALADHGDLVLSNIGGIADLSRGVASGR